MNARLKGFKSSLTVVTYESHKEKSQPAAIEQQDKLAQGFFDIPFYIQLSYLPNDQLTDTHKVERTILNFLEHQSVYTIDVNSFLKDKVNFSARNSNFSNLS